MATLVYVSCAISLAFNQDFSDPQYISMVDQVVLHKSNRASRFAITVTRDVTDT
jgi:hypothetical protein